MAVDFVKLVMLLCASKQPILFTSFSYGKQSLRPSLFLGRAFLLKAPAALHCLELSAQQLLVAVNNLFRESRQDHALREP